MPAVLMTLPQVAISDLSVAVNSSGELPTASMPDLRNCSLTSEVCSVRTISRFSRLMTDAGVCAGANIPAIDTASKPGSPEAETVGKPGASTDGWALVTANALSLPDFTCAMADTSLVKSACTSPASIAFIDSAPPL